MDKLKRAIIKEEYVAITGDTLGAVILNQMVYWSERVKDFDKFIAEENERFTKFNNNPASEPQTTELTSGWVYKKALELKDEIMSTDSEKTINRRLSDLVEKGFLDRRNNPKYKYDRMYQYRVNFSNIIKVMLEKGYMIQDYKVSLNFVVEALKTLNGQNDESNKTNDIESKRQIDDLTEQIVQLKKQIDVLQVQNDETIPKTTTEITTKTTTNREVAFSSSNLDKFFCYMSNEIGEATFNTFIKPLQLKEKENKITIITPSNFIKGMLENKLLDKIQRSVKVSYGIENIEIVSS